MALIFTENLQLFGANQEHLKYHRSIKNECNRARNN